MNLRLSAWVEINTGSKCKNIIICCANRHPDTDASKFIENFDHAFDKIYKVICILGDFNINLLNYETYSAVIQIIFSIL